MRSGSCEIKPRVKRQNKSSTGRNVRRRLTCATLLSFFLQEPIDDSVFLYTDGYFILLKYSLLSIYLFIYLFNMHNSFLKTFILSCVWPVPWWSSCSLGEIFEIFLKTGPLLVWSSVKKEKTNTSAECIWKINKVGFLRNCGFIFILARSPHRM